ncbi:flippase-like domain-containing protein [Pendulispora rubella]|uniref:Flippase-like domain-containing protein n=1 Tax=Pendulispora rubella TaxID=2741070 RepID=A0ABZ2LJG9_9BACT
MTAESSSPAPSESRSSESSTALEPPHGFFRRHTAKLVASAVITASLLFTLQKGGLKLLPDSGNFAHVRWWTLGGYFLTLVVMTYFRAVRWRFLLRSIATVPRRRVLAVSWIGFAAILLMPFRLGEFVRPFLIREKGKLSMTAATGTVVAERVVDGLYLSIILAIALITVPHVVPLPATVVGLPVSVAAVRRSGFVMLGVFTTAFIVIGVYYFAREWARRLTLAVFGLVSKKLGEKLADFAGRLADGLHAFGRGRDALGFLWESTIYWFANVGGMWLLAWGCGIVHGDGSAITFGEACALMGMLGVTVLIPGPPGLLGVFQAGIYAGMTMYFPTNVVTEQGAAYVFLLYMVQLVWTVVAALIFLVGQPGALKQLSASAEETVPAG